ncbi:MAG: M20/M25/M40 family metallo-hydrolase [Tannerellaceae bacterium]|nr:M20/M25/M40 family metallo-hydrolase [Tannerellaceae bacterium]MCD8264046.1 M20/M25/M40 family metallo-hydrolase [Tannerellaceae bacterium]
MKQSTHNFPVCSTITLILLIFHASYSYSQEIMLRDPLITHTVNSIHTDSLRTVVEDLVSFHNRNNFSSITNPTQGIGAAAEYLYQKASSYIPASDGRLSVEKIWYTAGGPGTSLEREVTLPNVIATIRGSNKNDNRIIALLAHYDSRSFERNDSTTYAPGANDDGSGIACLMELTRLLSAIDLPVTVKLMFLSGEEHGLHGARHMAKIAKEENWNLIAVINNDMIGNSNASETNTQTNTVVRVFSENIPFTETEEQRKERVYNSAENDSPSRQLARYIKEIGQRYVDNMEVKLIYRNDRFGRGGDHTPFYQQGFTGVRMCEIHENYDRTHQVVHEENGIRYGDEIWAVDFEYVRKNSGVNLATVLNMALAPDVPAHVRLDVSGLNNYTELSWETPVNGNVPAAYYVLVRETDQSNWQKKIRVKGNKAKLPYSKDNYFFAVQSIDEAGHESLAVFAKGSR